MAIRSVLVSLTGDTGDKKLAAGALALASGLGSRLEALHVRPDPRDLIPFALNGVDATVMDQVVAASETDAANREKAAREAYEAAASSTGDAALGLRVIVGNRAEELARAARLHDLVVALRSPTLETTVALETVLLSTGRPAYVVPPNGQPTMPKHTAIAWDGSAESVRALTAGLAFCEKSETVTVISIAEDGQEAPNLEGIIAYLARHDIGAAGMTHDGQGGVGPALLAAADKAGADMLVMGAYGHSRLAEFVLGGATRHVLGNAAIPLLMAH